MSYFRKIQILTKPTSLVGNQFVVIKNAGVLSFFSFLTNSVFRRIFVLPKLVVMTMKLFLCFAISTLCYSCVMERDLQAQITFATLVKVDEVHRYPYSNKKMYTWETDKFISFVTFESSSLDIPIGTKTRLLVFK